MGGSGHSAGGQRTESQRRSERTSERQIGSQRTGGRQLTEQMGRQETGSRDRSFEDHMTDELRIVLEDFSELSHVAAWCATECASGPPELGTCARVCQDVAEIAALNEMLIARDSMFGPDVADMFIRVAAEGLPELRRYQHHPHVAETIATIERTMTSCETGLRQVGRGAQMGGEGMQGLPEQGRHGQGMSGQPTGRSEMTGQQY